VPEFILSIFAVILVFFRSRSATAIEILALRQQVAVLKRKRPLPRLQLLDRLFWTTLRRFWSGWKDVLVIVNPETVIGWHRAGFQLYWRWRSRRRGRPRITAENPWIDPATSSGEPELGSPQDSRGVAETRLRGLRKERGSISATNSTPWRPG
jgi:putative transposase